MVKLLVVFLASLLVIEPALAQVYVGPRRPGKSVVRWFPQDWKYVDLLEGETVAGEESGGIRFFFYEQERPAAMQASAEIVDAYRYLADQFAYTPEKRFDYVLYDSYQEFLATNLFPLQEGTLGVTSPRSLEVTLPYFGDHDLFVEVSTHELVHEFTIQKVHSRAREAGYNRDPLNAIPLWFIEGMAEYYAKRGIDAETDMLIRDLVANPDILRFYGPIDFWLDAPGAFIFTYKYGQVRVAFLEEVYGEGTVQEVLDKSARLVESDFGLYVTSSTSFRELVSDVVGERPEKISAEFEAWIKRRSYPGWLEASQDRGDVSALQDVRGIPTALATSPDGTLMAYRTIDPYTGRSRLMLLDPRNPKVQRRVVADGTPGAESLHPTESRNFDLGDDTMVYIAGSRGHDVIYWGEVRHEAKVYEGDVPEQWEEDYGEDRPYYRIRLRTRDWDRFRLKEHGLVAAFSPSLSPDGQRVAFVSSSRGGTRDLYVLDREGNLTRLTNDPYAERFTAWGPDGIVFTSDATSHGTHNLFRVDPDGGDLVQLTTAAEEHSAPVVLPDGRVVFVAWNGAHADLHELRPDGVVTRTDTSTGFFEPTAAEDGLWAMMLHEGARHPVQLAEEDLLPPGEPVPQPEPGAPDPIGELPLAEAIAYRPLDPRHWSPNALFGYVGAGAGAIFGELFASASDRLKDHTLVATATMYGSFRLTDGYVAYFNQAARVSFGAGAFQGLRFRVDKTFDDGPLFQSNERFFGGLASVRYPFNHFTYVQLEQRLGGAELFLFDGTAAFLQREGLLDPWKSENAGIRFQTETIARFGIDTIQYHALTGPIAGWSVLAEVSGGAQPLHEEVFGNARFDAEQYFALPLIEGANIGWRASAGSSLKTRLSRSFFLSSYDSLRGVRFGDSKFLLGDHYFFARAEAQVPLNLVVQTAFASSLEAIAGVDVGAVADTIPDLWDKRVFDVALGGNVVLGPLILRIHFARAIDIGAPLPESERPWVPNISLSYTQL